MRYTCRQTCLVLFPTLPALLLILLRFNLGTRLAHIVHDPLAVRCRCRRMGCVVEMTVQFGRSSRVVYCVTVIGGESGRPVGDGA